MKCNSYSMMGIVLKIWCNNYIYNPKNFADDTIKKSSFLYLVFIQFLHIVRKRAREKIVLIRKYCCKCINSHSNIVAK